MKKIRHTKWMWVLLASWMFFAATTLCAFACEVNELKAYQHSCCPEKETTDSHSAKCCDEHNLVIQKIASPNEILAKHTFLFSIISYANPELILSDNSQDTYFSIQTIPKTIHKVSRVISNKAFLL